MNEISVQVNGVICKLCWSNISELKKYANIQVCPFKDDSFITDWENLNYRLINNGVMSFISNLDRTKIKKIVSVGSGIATTELLLLQYFNNAEIFLIDKQEITRPELLLDGECTPEIYRDRSNPRGFYNSWDVTKDAIQSSKLDQTKIHFLDPSDAWPDDVDLIISSYSWCWGYLKEEYWDRAINSLKVGGLLVLDVYRLSDKDVAQEISNQLGSEPFKVELMNIIDNPITGLKAKLKPGESQPKDYFIQFFNPDENGVYGGRYSWIRRK
jgi:hypothetical protein